VRRKGPRIGRNPKTGEEVVILPRRVVVFKPSTFLKRHINSAIYGNAPARISPSVAKRARTPVNG
jgi:integration host factor subunit alpha